MKPAQGFARATVFDSGAGNLHSLSRALVRLGLAVTVETDLARATKTSLLVLPGVGAFGAAADRFEQARDALRLRRALDV